MSDLRTRVVAAMKRLEEREGRASYEALFDTVIAELGLSKESESYAIPDSTRHRYVTDWAADESEAILGGTK